MYAPREMALQHTEIVLSLHAGGVCILVVFFFPDNIFPSVPLCSKTPLESPRGLNLAPPWWPTSAVSSWKPYRRRHQAKEP